jgi:MinD-like ATPase involved in chromosome partitioning or flagellar assembly
VRIVFALPAEDAERLATDAARYGHESVAIVDGAASLAAAVDQPGIDLVVAAANPRFLTDTVLARCDARGVRILAVLANETERRHASALGIYEYADATFLWSDYERLLGGGTPQPATSVSPSRGRVIAVWGPAGSPGRTSLAIGIAAELAAFGYSVALGDVDTHGAAIAPTLGMLDEAPGFAAACRLAGAGALNRTELERIGQRYGEGASGFWVLTGIGRPSRWPELSSDRVRGTIDECRSWVEFTVLDTAASIENDEEISSDLFAPRRNAATVTALREADVVIAVGAADPVGLSRFLRAFVDLNEVVEPDRVSVVMNKVRASAIGLNPAGQVTQTLSRFGGIQPAALVPFDQAGHDAAILTGRTLADVAPKSAARVALQQFVRQNLADSRKRQASGRGSRGRRAGERLA